MKSSVKADFDTAALRLSALAALGILAGCKSSPATDGLVVAPLMETPMASSSAGEGEPDAAAAPHRATVDPRPPRGQTCKRQIECLALMAAVPPWPYSHPYERCNPMPIGEVGRFSPTETAAHRTTEPDTCCYVGFVSCNGATPSFRRNNMVIRGRPLRDADGAKITAAPVERGDWARGRDAETVDEAHAAFWAAEGADEHGSIAEFSRLSLVLLGLGAPAELLTDVHRAALDEIAHARTCFSIASRYAGRAMGPGRLDVARADADDSIEALVRGTLADGCLGETAASVELASRAAIEADPAIQRALASMARDEARHAELAWRIVRFAMECDPDATREGIARFLAETEGAGALERSVLDEVVRPCVSALLTSYATPRAPRAGGCAREA